MNKSIIPLLAVVLLLSGCSGRTRTFVATGTVSYHGKPVDRAGVTFVPVVGRPASATTDTQGRFQLMTYEGPDGAVAGEHAVCVMKSTTEPPDEKHPYPVGRPLLPARYGNPRTTPLKVSVSSDKANDFTFELAD